MAIENAPYMNYTEITSYLEDIENGSEIPLFVVKTDNDISVSDITSENVLKIISYNNFKRQFNIDSDSYDSLSDTMKELDTYMKDFFVENSMYGENDDYGLAVPYVFIVDVGNAPTVEHYTKALSVSETKRKSTVVSFPNTEDIEFMKSVDLKLSEETKSGLLRIGYFAVSGQGEATKEFSRGTVARPTFDHHGYVDVVEGELKTTSGTTAFYNTKDQAVSPDKNHIYHDKTTDKYYKYENNAYAEVQLSNLGGYTGIVEGYKNNNKFYSDKEKTTEITSLDATKIYLDKTTGSNTDAYTYDGTDFVSITVQLKKKVILYSTDDDYKFYIPSTRVDVGGTNESFSDYCKRLSFISNEVQSSRVAIVEKDNHAKIIARICSTPYYIEPGYLPFMSVKTGIFNELDRDDRDTLFGTGLIFGEDDYTLSIVTPRICLATSTAWGIDDHDMRTTDALIHARRNVDHHIREIWRIIAPQLKRNETSVTLRYLQNQIDLYLDSELNKGTIMEYSVKVVESSYNPYKLLVKGKIIPVNSTLAIEFENVIGTPYAIAADYV